MVRKLVVIGVVEDSDEDFAVLRRVIGPAVAIRHWTTGEDALESLADERLLRELAILFVDFNLPGIDGAEVVRRVRREPGGSTLKVVVLSGSGSAALAMRAQEAGADRFEPKAKSLPQLRSIISRSMQLAA